MYYSFLEIGRNDLEIEIDFFVMSVVSCSRLDIPRLALTKNSNWFSETQQNISVAFSKTSGHKLTPMPASNYSYTPPTPGISLIFLSFIKSRILYSSN